MQALLNVAGYWPTVANDQFSHRLFEAVSQFQEANGFPASGILKRQLLCNSNGGRGLQCLFTVSGDPLGNNWVHYFLDQDNAQNAVLHGERLATLMSDLFRANIELGLPRSPPTPWQATVAAVPQPQLSPRQCLPRQRVRNRTTKNRSAPDFLCHPKVTSSPILMSWKIVVLCK
jgi:peptidoglycan hydrolase-like protein with peptidoglycan-binding domain